MLHSILSLRWVTLVAALGAALGAMLMFFEGCLKLAYALEMVVRPSADTETSVIATVMQATSCVPVWPCPNCVRLCHHLRLCLSPSPIAFEPRHPCGCTLRASGEIKITLIQVVLVYLVVDFVTDVVEAETRITWEMLVKPTAIVLIAGALRLIGTMHLNDQPDVSEQPRRTSETAQHLGEK